MIDGLIEIIGWYCVLSITVGLWMAAAIRYSRWRHDTKRDITYSPNKDGLGYLIAVVIGCPFLNIAALALILWAHYRAAADESGRKAWTK